MYSDLLFFAEVDPVKISAPSGVRRYVYNAVYYVDGLRFRVVFKLQRYRRKELSLPVVYSEFLMKSVSVFAAAVVISSVAAGLPEQETEKTADKTRNALKTVLSVFLMIFSLFHIADPKTFTSSV